MTIFLSLEQAPKYNGEPLLEIQVTNINIEISPEINGQKSFPTCVTVQFTFYGRTPAGNRLYLQDVTIPLNTLKVDNFIDLIFKKAQEGNNDYALCMEYLERVTADLIASLKSQYSTTNYQA